MSERRRIWETRDETVCLRDVDWAGNERIREFWVPSNGGYVREISPTHPGTLGPQVCERLAYQGSALRARPDTLLSTIRREHRKARAAEQRWRTS